MASPMINGAHNGMPLVIAPAQHFIPSNVSLIFVSRHLKFQPESLLKPQIRVLLHILPKIYNLDLKEPVSVVCPISSIR